MDKRKVSRTLDDLFESKAYLADPLFILHLDELELGDRSYDELPTLQVPQCIDDVFVKDSSDQRELREALVMWARAGAAPLSPDELQELTDTIRHRYLTLRERKIIQPIVDVDDEEIAAALREILPDRAPHGILSRVGRTLRKGITTVLRTSKDTGKAIVSRGYAFVDMLGKRISQVRWPEKSDELIKKKAEFTQRFFKFKGGATAKVVLTVAVSAAGLAVTLAATPAAPMLAAGVALGAGSIVLSVVDP